MVKAAHQLPLACAIALLSASLLHAKDLAAYRIGDTAEEDITTPVQLDVIDPDATAARKVEEAVKTPAIFRSYPNTAAQVENEFLAAFAGAHANFVAALQNIFHKPILGKATIASPDFEHFIADFNARNKSFPITFDLAAEWARGGMGAAIDDELHKSLLQMMQRPVRPDDLPDGFVLGETLRLMPVNDPKEKLTLDDTERHGRIIPQTSVVTISQLRGLFCEEFPKDQQSVARALAALLKPNCILDENLTQQARTRQVARLAVIAHYDAGEIVVQRGQTVDAKIKAALDQLYGKTAPGQLDRQIVAERGQAQQAREQAKQEHEQAQQAHDLAQREQEQSRQERERAQQEHGQMLKMHNQAIQMREQARTTQSQALAIRARNQWLVAALAGVSTLTLLALWGLVRHRRRALTTEIVPVGKGQPMLPANLAPYLAQTLKETVVQELAAQRRELLMVQEEAAVEITAMIRRLDSAQAPVRERLHLYETRILELEKELAVRNEENRELLKLKIEMIRRQLEAERTGNRMDFN
jgi:7TM-HD extracellular